MSFLLNDVKNHDNSVSFGLRRDHFQSQAAFIRATLSQARSWEFEMAEGCFGGVTPNWDSLHLELERFFA